MVALAPNTSETSTWDVLNTFPKLHSRAREVKTGICTDAPCSKSLDRVEIWLVIYESCVGLESFTRDPIGYLGGPLGLYDYVRGRTLNLVDPSGFSDLIPNSQSCTDFLRDVGEGDYNDAVGVPKSIANRLNNGGDYVFCGDCNGIQNRSWPDQGGRCHICLSDSATAYPDQWFAILAHELTHCDQYKCPKRNMPIVVGPPIPLPQGPVGGGDCTACQQVEAVAYKNQCGYLFPTNPIKKAACIKAGVCYSCAGACSKDRGFVGRCKSAAFPVYYPEPVVIPPNA